MKKNIRFVLLTIFSNVFIGCNLFAMDGGRVDGSMSREGMGFHQYRGGYHRSDGGYGYGRAYGAYGRHFGKYSHRGYDRYGSQGYVRKEADPRDNMVARSTNVNEGRKPIAGARRDNSSEGAQNSTLRTDRALLNKPRGGQYWGYYSPDYQYGLYPWYNNGDPYYYYQKADYYPWHYGYNPGWLWW